MTKPNPTYVVQLDSLVPDVIAAHERGDVLKTAENGDVSILLCRNCWAPMGYTDATGRFAQMAVRHEAAEDGAPPTAAQKLAAAVDAPLLPPLRISKN